MIFNYILWVLTGLAVGYGFFYFDLNKKKELEVHLFVGLITTFLGALLIQTLIWPDPVGEINFVALVLGAGVGAFMLWWIDYFFHI